MSRVMDQHLAGYLPSSYTKKIGGEEGEPPKLPLYTCLIPTNVSLYSSHQSFKYV